jgi:steroid 5-alpha reductase family enzyme
MTASGVTFLEKTLKVTKPCYADYVAHISAFFPWLPRKL